MSLFLESKATQTPPECSGRCGGAPLCTKSQRAAHVERTWWRPPRSSDFVLLLLCEHRKIWVELVSMPFGRGLECTTRWSCEVVFGLEVELSRNVHWVNGVWPVSDTREDRHPLDVPSSCRLCVGRSNAFLVVNKPSCWFVTNRSNSLSWKRLCSTVFVGTSHGPHASKQVVTPIQAKDLRQASQSLLDMLASQTHAAVHLSLLQFVGVDLPRNMWDLTELQA